MYDYGARFYDPSLSLWISVDPAAEVALDWTPYRYGFNNPIQYTDPDGMFEDKKTAAAFQKEHNICGTLHEQDGVHYIQGTGDNAGQQYSYGGTSTGYGADVPSGKRLSIGDTREFKLPDSKGVDFSTGIFGTSRTETYAGEGNWEATEDFSYVKHQKAASSLLPIGAGLNAIKGAGVVVNLLGKTLKSGSQLYKGSTRLGHSLSKHAGRNPQIWGKLRGDKSTWHNQALNHYSDFINAPGDFKKVANPEGVKFLEKWLPDGRGMRLNMDRTFKGFID